MKKKLLTILICVFLACFSSFVLTACSKSTEGLEYSINYDGKTVSVTSVGSVIEKKIVIPSKYNDFEVVAISEDAFNDCRFITDVTIPNTVTKIGANAFKNCINLTNITIPNSVTSIGWDAFRGCSSIEKINYLGTADEWANITIYSGSLGSIANAKFYLKNKLPTNIKITTATYIRENAFSGFTSLKSVTLGDSVTRIGNSAFAGCSNLTSIKISDSVTSIGNSAFSGCSSLTSIEIPNSVKSLGDGVFRNCSSLTDVTLGAGITRIGDLAFGDCTNLKDVIIPKQVTKIHKDAFSGCVRLSTVTFEDSSFWNVTKNEENWESCWMGTEIDVSSPSSNASKFRSYNRDYYWYKLR